MIREIVLYPTVGVLLLTMAVQLSEIAESASDKTLVFAQDMENAVDCATRGIDLAVCSPNLFNHDFQAEINATIDVLEDKEMMYR